MQCTKNCEDNNTKYGHTVKECITLFECKCQVLKYLCAVQRKKGEWEQDDDKQTLTHIHTLTQL